MKFGFLTRGAIALIAVPGLIVSAADTPSQARLLEKARQIHSRMVTFDSHLDLPFDYAGASAEGETQFDLPKVARGQLKAAAIAVFVPQGPRTAEGFAKARADADKKYQLIKSIVDENPSRAAIAYSPDDVRRISAQGKFAVVISMLNAYPLGSDLSQLDTWYNRGVRILGFTHAGNNDWSDSSRPSQALKDQPGEHGGLSELGKKGVAHLNELGILIDVSQLTTLALKQVLNLTKAPVAATHSGLKAIVDAPRNLSDEELDLIKKNGGVVQVVAFSNYLRKTPEAAAGSPPTAPATVAQFVDAISYAVKKIGVDHVGIQPRWRGCRMAERRRGAKCHSRAYPARVFRA
jgi:membrane dipeptidase